MNYDASAIATESECSATSLISFDQDGALVDASGEFLNSISNCADEQSLQAILSDYLTQQIEKRGFNPERLDNNWHSSLDAWQHATTSPLIFCHPNGNSKILTVCPGNQKTTYVSTSVEKLQNDATMAEFAIENHMKPMWVNDLDSGELLYFNKAAEVLYGLTDPTSTPAIRDILSFENDNLEIQDKLLTQKSVEVDLVKTRTASGEDLWTRGAVSLHTYKDRTIVIGSVDNVTDKSQHEQELISAHNILKDAMESLSEGFALYDDQFRLVMFNERYREMNQVVSDLLQPGLDWEILMRESARRGIYADAIGNEEAWVSDRLENGIEFIQDYELKQTDGTWFLVSVHPTSLGGFVVTRTDITAKKQAEASEREGDLLVRLVLETSSAAVVMAHIGTGEIIYRSPAATELFGSKKNARDHYKNSDDRADYMTNLLADGRVRDYKMEFVRANGTPFPGLTSGQIVEYKGEEVVVSAITDVTEQIEAEAMIRNILDACTVPLQMTELESGRQLFRSRETISMFGQSDSAKSYYADPSDREKYIQELRQDKFVSERRARLYNANGEIFWGAVSARLIEFNGADVIVSNTRDLTDELAMQEELATQKEMLFQNEKLSALGELLAGVAHELNNPLSVVVGHSLMLREELTGHDALRRVEKISSAAERCAKIVKTFLAMARQNPAKMENTDVNSLIVTATDVVSLGHEENGIELIFTEKQNLPPISADGDQIVQVFINLLTNAEQAMVKSSQGSRIKIETAIDMEKGNVVVSTTDDGPGIPEAIKARIFEPFFTTKDVGEGTGIGLAFSHRIIHSHGGHIWLDQSYEGGSRFFVSLPIATAKSDSFLNEENFSSVDSPKRILVVDDEDDVRELIAEILTKDGFLVDQANNGKVAITKIKKQKYDALLSDLNMPDVDGRGLFVFLQSDKPDLLKKTGFITGDTMGNASLRLMKEANRPFMEKPVSPSELRNLVYTLLAGHSEDADAR